MDMVQGGGRRVRGEARNFWTMHLDAQAQSGVGVAEYCRRHGLGAASFYGWRGRLSREASGGLPSRPAQAGDAAGSFREVLRQEPTAGVAGSAPAACEGAGIEISAFRIRLVDERQLGEVLAALVRW